MPLLCREFFAFWVALSVLSLLLFSVAGCNGGDDLSGSSLSGVRGIASVGPLNPVERPGVPNERPLQGAVIVTRTSDGRREVARAVTGEDGGFRLGLAAGTYLLVSLPPRDAPTLRPPADQTVTVPSRTFVVVNPSYDTGIR